MSKRPEVATVQITHSEARAVMLRWLRDSKIFVAKNVKADGKPRTWRVHPKAGRDLILGTGASAPSNPMMLKVFDFGLAAPQALGLGLFLKPDPALNAWRTFNVGTATYLRRGNEAYTIQG